MSKNDQARAQTQNDGGFMVRLDRSRSPGAFEDDENLWESDLRRIYRLIERQIAILGGAGQEVARQPSKLSIAVFGPSGSGKSSLLRTLRHDVQRKNGLLAARDEYRSNGVWSKVISMPVMDPTTWAASDQFLYAFLAAALEEDRKNLEKAQHSYQQGLSPVQLAFQEVNEYLRVLDDPVAIEEHDPLGLSLQKLERHTSGLRLREVLREFIDTLAKEFKAEVILLPVDDLDMAPDHLVASLNTYQSYLNHPQLVPIFTFTDRMPEELIEAYYDRRLESPAPPRVPPGEIARLSISQQLALQFLARCFPVRNRIRLGPAPARVQRARWKRSSSADEGSVLELLAVASFLLFGHPDKEDTHIVSSALRSSTLRRQLQVFDAMASCRVDKFMVPQLRLLAHGRLHCLEEESVSSLAIEIEGLATGRTPVGPDPHWMEFVRGIAGLPSGSLPEPAPTGQAADTASVPVSRRAVPRKALLDPQRRAWVEELAATLAGLRIGATWATIFDRATWALLNVHRDTLRELGLYLEDLYSWSPFELRSYVLDNILSRDRVTRRTVLDRWFNRADFRRSQVLSLLAANIFRPWMAGEEPYGDDESAIRKTLELERAAGAGLGAPPIDLVDRESDQWILDRLTLPAQDGLLWFLNVTLGFYLPLTMARDWRDALSSDEPVKGRMSGSGWELSHAPINAIRIADAKTEILSFGMHFLDPNGYRRALDATAYDSSSAESGWRALAWGGSDPSWRSHLLLRIWSCCGYSHGRYWAAISLWRGLGLIGQILQQARRYNDLAGSQGDLHRAALAREIERLIRSHCLSGLVPGSLLSRNSTEGDLLQGFPAWEPAKLADPITELADEIVDWLCEHRTDTLLPFPVADLEIGWKDCFVRRVHGDYILGALWPRLHSAYLERQERNDDHHLADRRSLPDAELDDTRRQELRGLAEAGEGGALEAPGLFQWTASVAVSAWSDGLLDYWRGCRPILQQLLTCPVFLKSQKKGEGARAWEKRLGLPDHCLDPYEADEGRGRPPNRWVEKRSVVGDTFAIRRAPIRLFTPREVEYRSLRTETGDILRVEVNHAAERAPQRDDRRSGAPPDPEPPPAPDPRAHR